MTEWVRLGSTCRVHSDMLSLNKSCGLAWVGRRGRRGTHAACMPASVVCMARVGVSASMCAARAAMAACVLARCARARRRCRRRRRASARGGQRHATDAPARERQATGRMRRPNTALGGPWPTSCAAGAGRGHRTHGSATHPRTRTPALPVRTVNSARSRTRTRPHVGVGLS